MACLKNGDYGQNGPKHPFVRKNSDVSDLILRTNVPKKAFLSVNPHHNGQKFTDKSLKNAGLSVKCVLLTDKSAKNGTLSVNLDGILAELVEQYCISKDSFFCVKNERNNLRIQSQIDRLRLVFYLIQVRNGTFPQPLIRFFRMHDDYLP